MLSSCSRAVRSATCCLTFLCSVLSFSSFSFILLRVCIMSSFSCVLASHSRSFFSNFCWSSWCSKIKTNKKKKSVSLSYYCHFRTNSFQVFFTAATSTPFLIFSACSFHCLTSFSLTSLQRGGHIIILRLFLKGRFPSLEREATFKPKL